MSMLTDMTLKDFNNLLASKEAAPGGGSTSALSGAMGAALTAMVVNLSVGRKFYEALDASVKEGMQRDFEKVEALRGELTGLVDEDAKAFRLYMEASGMPKGTEEERTRREDAIQKASLYALQIPLETAEKCLQILRHQKLIAEYGNKNAVSDIGVGALLALAGLEGAALNVRINLPGIADGEVRKTAEEKITALLEEGRKLQAETMEIVNSRIAPPNC